MDLNRRNFIRGLGIGIAAGVSVPFVPSLIPDLKNPYSALIQDHIDTIYDVALDGIDFGSAPLTFEQFESWFEKEKTREIFVPHV